MMITMKTAIIAAAVCIGAVLGQPTQGRAQILPSPAWYVVGCNGGSATLPFKGNGWDTRYDSAVVSYTVGETCIAFGAADNFDLTEGFQQPDGYGIKPYDPFDAIQNVTFYPNPCRQFSIVNFYLNESFTTLALKVFDVRGNVVYSDEFQAGDGNLKYQLPVMALAPGMYIVEIVGFTQKRYVGKLIVIP
jgi:hypothetical protein